MSLSAVASQTINHALEIDEWQLVDQQFDPDQLMLKETLFSLANGFIGSRGTYEEGALAALAIVAAGLLPVVLLARTQFRQAPAGSRRPPTIAHDNPRP